jgi:DNA polymerase III alpha subunit
LLYEENVIAVLERVTGGTAEEADELRAAIVRGEDVAATFSARAEANGFAPAVTRRIWSDVSRFAAYSFSKAHAASVALVAYQSAFAKTHHAAAFACAVLNHHGGLYPLRSVAAELGRGGVIIRPPDVNVSETRSALRDGVVRVGFDKLRHVNERTKLALLRARANGGPFRSLGDLTARVSITRRELEALVLSGSCDRLEPLSPESYPFAHEVVLGAEPHVPRAAAAPEQVELFRALVRANNELRFLGMHPSNHPMKLLRPEARRAGCIGTAEVQAQAGRRIRLSTLVAAARRIRTAADEVMQFVTLEDEEGLLEAVVPTPVYLKLEDPIKNPGPYLVEGYVELDVGVPTVRVDTVKPFHRRARPYAA